MKEVDSHPALMDDFEQMIKEAEILLRGSDREQRESGRQKLIEVMRLAEGTVYASQASELLANWDEQASERPNPKLDELMRLWPSIQGFADYRLAGFLRRMESYPGKALTLRTEVIRDLRKWILDELPQIGDGARSTKIAALNEFVSAVRGVAAYEELPEFGQLRDGLFQIRLQETITLVDRALEAWTPDEAQRLLDELAPLPDAFKPQVERLQADVYEVDRQRRSVEELLRELDSEAPTTWFETRLQLELLEQLERYLPPATRVPTDWRFRLDEACVRVSGFVEQFIRTKALSARTLQQLHDFWTKFKHLTSGGNEARWQMDEDWFRPGLDTLLSEVSRNVERAKRPDDLIVISSQLREDAEGLPEVIAKRVAELTDVIANSAAGWKAMRDGQTFELSETGSATLPVSKAGRAEVARYRAWLQQIETAFTKLRSEELSASEGDYQEALQVAEEILKQIPGHALAHKLKVEATRRISCHRLDRALSDWDLETFFNLFKDNNPGEIYSALATEKKVLADLRALTRQVPLKDWRTSAEWWASWQAGSKNLPSAKPDSLSQALDQHVARRYEEWYAALDRLLQQNNLTPQEYETAAKSLPGDGDTNLRTYQQELQRKATIGRIEQHIKDGHLAEAEQELNQKLPLESTDAGRLRTHLKIVQVRGLGSVAAAEYLSTDWENVKTFAELPQDILLDTIQAVWVEDRQDWISKLAQLISRVLTRDAPQDPTTRRLAEWQVWLQIEEKLLRSFSSSGVKQLADYLRTAEPGALLDQRLTKLVRQWQVENNTVMLAWAFQAFQHKSNAAVEFDQAADDLVKESDRVADDVQRVLAERATLELADLTPLQLSLQREEERWRSLDDFLGLYLPHPVQHRQPSQNFAKAKRKVGELIRVMTSLNRLEQADLRQESARREFEDASARARRLNDTASQTRLVDSFERLRPLQEDLFFFEQRIRETAERCRSKAALDVLESGLFKQLASHVQKVVEIFVTADAKASAMWSLVSAEYESWIYREACVLRPLSGLLQLDQLVETLESLHTEELEFVRALNLMEDREHQPIVPGSGAFDPTSHLDYLRLIPQHEPGSVKIYHRFDRARRDTLKNILEASESWPHLPVWVRDYLEKGVPACADAA